jgi:C-terminal processing protease CtpA/Prc
MRWIAWVGSVGLVLTAGPADAQRMSCSVPAQNLFVRDHLQDIYLWAEDLPDLDPLAFGSPEAYLEAVRHRPLDTSYSYIAPRAAHEAFFSDSEFIGFGFSSKQDDGGIRVGQVFPESPAADAGLERGATLLAIDGRPVDELLAAGGYAAALGPDAVGVTVQLTWRSPDGTRRQETLAKGVVRIPTVSDLAVVDWNGRRVGYLHFRNFVGPSVAALDLAFEELLQAGVDELVLDLRYNGGGLLAVAQHLGGLIGGAGTEGEVFTQLVHNTANSSRNVAYPYPPSPPAALELTRIAIITTHGSASASELLITALRPFVSLGVIGDTTYGKPVGQYSYNFCEKTLVPVAFRFLNARGEGDFFEGIPADCAAADDLDVALGDPREASFAEALHWLTTGACSQAAQARGSVSAQSRPRSDRSGWQDLVGAH